jgi:glutamate-1-semialdehyde 2,1-aminomutase
MAAHATGYGSIFVNYFMAHPVETYRDLLRNNTETDLIFRRKMVEKGILMSARNIRRSVIGVSHSTDDIDIALTKAREALVEILKFRK